MAPLLHIDQALDRAAGLLQSHQTPDGFWWYTLEANETIGAEYIFLEHCLGVGQTERWARIARRILAQQRPDGSWALAHGIDGDLSTTVECYVALRMAGVAREDPALCKAHAFIESGGGLANVRVFTQVHFAALGLVPWSEPPSMPVEIMLLPSWAPFSVYSFSSWARACIIPLLVVMAKHPVWPVPVNGLADELPPGDPKQRKLARGDIWAEFFHWVDRIMKLTGPFAKRRPTKGLALRRAEEWIRAHIARTEDIFPALSYGALALAALGHSEFDPTITKALAGLRRFQHACADALPALPFSPTSGDHDYAASRTANQAPLIHQQCCISPVWDTPWAMCALQAGGLSPDHPVLVRAGRWLLEKQITDFAGDWQKKNPDGLPGGWSFEFENDFFPDVDDTIQVLLAFHGTTLPREAVARATARGLQWCLSMQNDDGGWAAFDKNNSLAIVNKIPFADHGACLDPSSPDITGRMLQLLALHGYSPRDRCVARAIAYLQRTQENDGSWFGRWGVNYVYGTWATITGLAAIGHPAASPEIRRGADWLESVQHDDGGFGESVDSYPREAFVPGPPCASQTAWGLMGLTAAGRAQGEAATSAARWLVDHQQPDGRWDEPQYTGTGFPGHFYIRYHGYRHYFPLLALGVWRNAVAAIPMAR